MCRNKKLINLNIAHCIRRAISRGRDTELVRNQYATASTHQTGTSKVALGSIKTVESVLWKRVKKMAGKTTACGLRPVGTKFSISLAALSLEMCL